ncbi:MAG: glycerate kinase [Acidobacteriaceae bacterium]
MKGETNLKEIARRIFEQALAECSIERAFDRKLRVVDYAAGMRLLVEGNDAIAFDRLRRVRIVAAGKAAAAMLDALLARLRLPNTCDLQGVLIAAERPANLPATIQYFCGGHPLPNESSFAGASATLAMLHALGDTSVDDTLCIFLLSGGASAMMELPLDEAISLDDTIAFHRVLVHSGASIVEMNCVRKHFSAVKGGRLALAAGRLQTLSLLVSDVPPAHLDALGSGPTMGDSATVAECREILARYGLMEKFPAPVRRFFASAELPETPKPGELNARVCKLLDSDEMAEAARSHAERLGFYAVIDNACDDWSYDAAAEYLLNRLRELRREHSRVCLISAGEVTVRVESASANARGGRNQHFALHMATQLRAEDGPIAVLSAGSDGIDGNSDAAGAIVDEHTLDGENRRESALRALAEFDSSSWLSAAGDTIVTGPTGHNLRDLRIFLADTAP